MKAYFLKLDKYDAIRKYFNIWAFKAPILQKSEALHRAYSLCHIREKETAFIGVNVQSRLFGI